MRLKKAERDQNHDRIVAAAARLFREKGIDGVGLDEIMAEAGLTHGGFYGHFKSKAALAAEASEFAFTQALERLLPASEGKPVSAGTFARRYLSVEHRDNPGLGCAVAAIGPDISRQGGEAQASFARNIAAAVDRLAASLPGDAAAARQTAIVNYAAMIGAMVIARSVGSDSLSEDFLRVVKERVEASSAG